jgi:thymidine kinase (EC 2.7.1.21)
MASLHFHYSTMNAGKSALLLKDNHNYIERGMQTLVLKPGIDTREDKAVVRSRMGQETPCVLFSPEENLYTFIGDKWVENPKIVCVFIDEVQFLTKEQVIQLTEVVDILGIPVMAYGLRTDFQGNLFDGTSMLFARSDRLVEIRTICWCGKRADMVLRLNGNGEVVREGNQVEIGGNDSYVSVCRKHHRTGEIKGK